MAHSALAKDQQKYSKINYIVRARLYKGLMEESMSVGSICQDERIKMASGGKCSYCGGSELLSIDHVFPRFVGGIDRCDNLVYACRKCNSSKGKKDLMEWMRERDQFPPLMVLRRYLKLAIDWSSNNAAMELDLQSAKEFGLPFNIDLIPIRFPPPGNLSLTAEKHDNHAVSLETTQR
jgi:hypothetical protein